MSPNMRSYFNKPQLSDVKIRQIKDGRVREYFAHKVVLASASPYFERMFEGSFQESSSPTIDLHDDDTEIFELLLKSIYNGESEIDVLYEKEEIEQARFLVLTIQLERIADKYLVEQFGNVVGAFIDSLIDGFINLSFEELKSIVETYYSPSVGADTRTGIAIAMAVLDGDADLVGYEKEFGALMVAQPIFAVDMALIKLRHGQLSL